MLDNYKVMDDRGLTVDDRGFFSRYNSDIRGAEGNQIATDGNSADIWASAANPNVNYGANNYCHLPSTLRESEERW
jgi:lipocalin